MPLIRKFPELKSRFLLAKLADLRTKYGTNSSRYRGLAYQYDFDSREDSETEESNLKHYEAAFSEAKHDGQSRLERLYRRAVVIEPTMACASHCRYCLRSNYPRSTMTEAEIVEVAKLCGSNELGRSLTEVLITGGDPLMIPKRVDFLLDALIEYAPNIKIVRIASRVPTQDPDRIDDDVVRLFKNKPSLRFELATQINHPVELEFTETVDAFRRIQEVGARIYCQNVLLKGVNDDLPTLVDLYDNIRAAEMEAHYLFHAIPLAGTSHLRTTVRRGIDLASGLTSCGAISGRVKPMYAVMTDIGKITLYDGTIVESHGRYLLLQSRYRIADRLVWNPEWNKPQTAEIDTDGYLRVWYLDGHD